jgi:carboxypeptidase C (cathepsin A)
MDHMDLSPELRDNIQFEYFESGHMMYVHEPSLVKFKEDVARFVRDSH